MRGDILIIFGLFDGRQCARGKPGRIAPIFLLLLISLAAISLSAGAASPAVVSIAASNSTSAALMEDGSVWEWGYDHGSIYWSEPHQIDISGVTMVAPGYGHVLALKSDGSVWAWGTNTYGQLGDGTYEDSSAPLKVQGLDHIVAIAAGKDHSIALRNDGTVWAWGSNSYGQLGIGSLNVKGSGTPVQVKDLTGIVAISSGGSHSMALDSVGALWAWGDNAHGVLGDGTNEARFSPVRSKASDIKAFDAGVSHALAVKTDGSVWAWGYNFKGQLGKGGVSPGDNGQTSIGPQTDSYNPDIVHGISDAVAVAAGGTHSAALIKNGTLWTWGANGDGQLGLGMVGGNDVTGPRMVTGLDNVTAVSAGMYHTLALKKDGTVWAWGSNSEGQIGNTSVSSNAASPMRVVMGSQLPPSPTPIIAVVGSSIAASPSPAATQGPAGFNYVLLIIGLLLLVLIIAAAYFLTFRKK